MERDDVFSLQDYLAVLRRQRGLIALVAVFAAVGGAVWFVLQTPMYEAQAELELERVRAAQDVSLDELLNPTGNVRDTDVDGVTSPSVARSAAELLGRDDPSQLRTQVEAEAVAEDRILRITATDADPVTAAQIADAFATAFIEYRRQEAVETVLLAQEELDQRASEIREEISAVDAQIAALGIPPSAIDEPEAADDDTAEGEAADGEAGAETQAAEDPDAVGDEQQDTQTAGSEPTPEELDELETLQIRRNALRTQLSQVIARSTELGESADALTGFAADFTPAAVPSTPVGNTIVEVVGVAFILGLALGIALAFVRDHFDDVIRDEDDFKRASEGRPVLGRIPMWKPRDHDTERVASLVDPTSSAAEAYRELSAGVRFLLVAQADDPEHDAAAHHGLTRSRVVMICSATIGEGKTETAANLAVAAARVGLRTVLLDADLRRPAVARRFGLGRTTGLSDALLNGEPAESHMVDVGVDDLQVLPAGTIPPNPAELLASPAMRALQQGLLRKYDLIVIDTPAVLAVPDALEIGPYVDLAVMVGRIGQTGRRKLGAAVERLEQVGSAVSGTVLNGLNRATDGYYYAYTYEETPEKKSRRQTRRERKEAEVKAKADAKAEAKQAKIDAKQAKIDAKAAKRAGKRQRRRGGGRRDGEDVQVQQTLRTAGGAVAVIGTSAAGAAADRAGADGTDPDAVGVDADGADRDAVGADADGADRDAVGVDADGVDAVVVDEADADADGLPEPVQADDTAETVRVLGRPADELVASDAPAPIGEATAPEASAAPAPTDDEPVAATGEQTVAVAPSTAGASDSEPTPIAKTEPEAEPAAEVKTELQPEPTPEARNEPQPEPTSETEPEPEVAPAREAKAELEPEPTPERASSEPVRRRSRRKTRIPATKPAATRRRTAPSEDQTSPADGLDVEVQVPERPVVRVSSGATDEDDNLLFSERTEPDAST